MKRLGLEEKLLNDQKVLVVGAGRSGISVSRVLARMGANVTLTDIKTDPGEEGAFQGLLNAGVSLELGKHHPSSFLNAQHIILSPGVPTTLAPLLKAQKKGIPIEGELEFASSHLRGRWVAVTGTNGKSTTTSLIGNLLKKRFKTVFVGGNLGKPLSEALLERSEWDALVVEVSSFQLETIHQFHPSIGVLLNVSPDHMDRYSHFSDYVDAKARLFQNMDKNDWVVANGDDSVVMEMVQPIPCSVMTFHLNQKPSRGIFLDREEIISTFNGNPKTILKAKDISLLGEHNLQNVMAAVAVGEILGCSVEDIRAAMTQFRGLEHRMERVREMNGVQFINDSKGTNVGALKISLKSIPSSVVLIAGGRDKGGEFESLEGLVKEKVRFSILMGEAAPRIEKAWNCKPTSFRAFNMDEAVQKAWEVAKPGDVVLFSPGCSSFDMFRDFEERGQTFKKSVWGLSP